MLDLKTFSLEKLCRWYMIHGFLYYKLDHSVISDTDYDLICEELLTFYILIPDKWKVFITEENLKAGTAYNVKFYDAPSRVRSVAQGLLDGTIGTVDIKDRSNIAYDEDIDAFIQDTDVFIQKIKKSGS